MENINDSLAELLPRIADQQITIAPAVSLH